jgi:thiamine biosynthesis lipoprotein
LHLPTDIDVKECSSVTTTIRDARGAPTLAFMRPEPIGWDDLHAAARFRAMNTQVEIIARDPRSSALLGEAERWCHAFEQQFSRFLPESELSRFNARSVERVTVSAEFAGLLALAKRLHEETHGMFEPAVLPQLEAAGYDRSFDRIDGAGAVGRASAPLESHSVREVTIDASNVVEAPLGLRLDFGGIGKGYAVDRMAAMLAPARDFIINAGGDIYASGECATGGGWYASVADPYDYEHDLSLVWLRDAALATSTTAIRRWQRGGDVMHHIIDPRTDARRRTTSSRRP